MENNQTKTDLRRIIDMQSLEDSEGKIFHKNEAVNSNNTVMSTEGGVKRHLCLKLKMLIGEILKKPFFRRHGLVMLLRLVC